MTEKQKEALLMLLDALVTAQCNTHDCDACWGKMDACPSFLYNQVKDAFESEEETDD